VEGPLRVVIVTPLINVDEEDDVACPTPPDPGPDPDTETSPPFVVAELVLNNFPNLINNL
jgi:hypothetical protein